MSHMPLIWNAPAPTAEDMATIARIARNDAGIVILPDKTSMVQSRLARRLRALGHDDFATYLGLVTSPEGPAERRRMISALTTNVSQFFRERHHFDTFEREVLPTLVARARAGGKVRLWSAGCSNGQEAWTMAMSLLTRMPDAAEHDIRILATDISCEVIATARRGIYQGGLLEGLTKAARERFFQPVPGGQSICATARRIVSFHELNLHAPWPMKQPLDAIFCRNVVIYFDPAAQVALWRRFAAALAPGGWLFVGHSERVPVAPETDFVTAGITTYRVPGATEN